MLLEESGPEQQGVMSDTNSTPDVNDIAVQGASCADTFVDSGNMIYFNDCFDTDSLLIQSHRLEKRELRTI